MLERIVSGGQVSADQAGLRVARQFGIPTGGWMPSGWKTSRGPDPELAREFGLCEHSGDYADRTAANVHMACGTLRFAADFNALGERCTLKWIRRYKKPHLDIDMHAPPAVELVVAWLRRHQIKVLNISGNVEPKSTKARAYGITAFVDIFLAKVLYALLPRDSD